jgi:hypothetical protein
VLVMDNRYPSRIGDFFKVLYLYIYIYIGEKLESGAYCMQLRIHVEMLNYFASLPGDITFSCSISCDLFDVHLRVRANRGWHGARMCIQYNLTPICMIIDFKE